MNYVNRERKKKSILHHRLFNIHMHNAYQLYFMNYMLCIVSFERNDFSVKCNQKKKRRKIYTTQNVLQCDILRQYFHVKTIINLTLPHLSFSHPQKWKLKNWFM